MLYFAIFIYFFFSSRRRHTRSYGDWSSDVCSSDLRTAPCRATAEVPPSSPGKPADRSEEHTSELRHRTISYAVFCLKKKNTNKKVLCKKKKKNKRSKQHIKKKIK